MTRTGTEYIESLRDGREVWFDGERVKDVTVHPAFHNTIRSIARLYDLTHEPELRDVLTVPGNNGRVLRAYQIPRSRADLVAKRVAFKTWAEASFGFLGRSPDYMANAVAGFATAPDVFRGNVFD